MRLSRVKKRDISIKRIADERKALLEKSITELKDAIENPSKYTRRAVVSFDYTEFKSKEPFPVCVKEEGKEAYSAILDPDFCCNFEILRNNSEYDVTCVTFDDELYLFDYKIILDDDDYTYAKKHVFELESEEEYKLNPQIMFSISGQVGNIERNKTEFFIYDLEKNIIVSDCRIYFDNPKKYDLKPGDFYDVEFLQHEHSLAVISMKKINKPSNYKKLECFWDYREK